MSAMSTQRKRDENGRFLPLGNTPREVIVLSPKQANTRKKVVAVLGIAALVYVAVKAFEMLDIQENIRVGVAGLRNAKMTGKFPFYTGFSFTLDIKLQNITKSSMTISQPFTILEVRRAAMDGKPAAKAELTTSKVKKGNVEILPQADTLVSLDFEISFLSLGQAGTLIDKPVAVFLGIYNEIVKPTGKDGKPDFKRILEGTGLSIWSATTIYAAGIYKTVLEEQIF